ncbi:MAG: transferase, partial [Actinomycetota bacterium]|nr:transferase [Actinomycetota bacterium]
MRAAVGTPATFDVVVPTIGRPSLTTLLEALAAGRGPAPARVLLVDDRGKGAGGAEPLLGDGPPAALAPSLEVLAGAGRGPA